MLNNALSPPSSNIDNNYRLAPARRSGNYSSDSWSPRQQHPKLLKRIEQKVSKSDVRIKTSNFPPYFSVEFH